MKKKPRCARQQGCEPRERAGTASPSRWRSKEAIGGALELLGALGHGARAAADGVGHEEVGESGREGRWVDLARGGGGGGGSAGAGEGDGLHLVDGCKVRRHVLEARAHLVDGVVGQADAEHVAQRAQNGPVVTRLADESGGGTRAQWAALAVDIGAALLRVGGAGQNDRRARCARVAVVALVDDKRVLGDAEEIRAEIVCAEQIGELDGLAGDGARAGHKAQVESSRASGGELQVADAVPVGAAQLWEGAGQRLDGGGNGAAVGAAQRGDADEHHGPRGGLERLSEWVLAGEDLREQLRAAAEVLHRVGRVHRRSDRRHKQVRVAHCLADASVDERRLHARVGADQQQHVGLLDAGDARVEQVVGAQVGVPRGAVLATLEVLHAQAIHQVLERNHRLGVDEVAHHGLDLVGAHARKLRLDHAERLAPRDRRQHALRVARHGLVEALALESVVGEARLVADPLFVHILVQPRQNAHHLGAARVDADTGARGLEHVDRLGLVELPRPRREGEGLGGERAHGAQVDHVARHFGIEQLLHVGANLHGVAATRRAQSLHAGDLRGEAHAARAVDATRHHSLDERAEVLVLHRALELAEARLVAAKRHALVLQVALAALVADGAVQRVVGQQELHHALARLEHHLGRGADLHAGHGRHGARRHGLGRLLHLDETHAAVAGDRQAVVVAEARNVHARHLARLQHRHALGHEHFAAVHLHLDLVRRHGLGGGRGCRGGGGRGSARRGGSRGCGRSTAASGGGGGGGGGLSASPKRARYSKRAHKAATRGRGEQRPHGRGRASAQCAAHGRGGSQHVTDGRRRRRRRQKQQQQAQASFCVLNCADPCFPRRARRDTIEAGKCPTWRPRHWPLRAAQAGSLSGVDLDSRFEQWLNRHVCEPLVRIVPLRVKPNTITLLNHAVIWLSVAAGWAAVQVDESAEEYASGVMRAGRSLWQARGTALALRLLMAAFVFASMVLDSLDGMHARRTQQTSRLGEVLDHAFDAANIPLIGAGVLLTMSSDRLTIAISMVSSGLVFNSQLVLYRHLRRMVKPPANGPESQMLIVGAEVVSGLACFALGRWSAAVNTVLLVIYVVANVIQVRNFVYFWRQLAAFGCNPVDHVRFCVLVFAHALLYLQGRMSDAVFVISAALIAFRLSGAYVLFVVAERNASADRAASGRAPVELRSRFSSLQSGWDWPMLCAVLLSALAPANGMTQLQVLAITAALVVGLTVADLFHCLPHLVPATRRGEGLLRLLL